ncbi:MAG: hypothetical protein KY476_11610 [Planctomycetes bacterium]|nr:hypothetical protein [Planctomycetota bacterium]
MNWLIETALANAVVVTVLAVFVLAASAAFRKPALTHALWLLVLVKFVTPPLIGVPVPVDVAVLASGATPAAPSPPPRTATAAASVAEWTETGATFRSPESAVSRRSAAPLPLDRALVPARRPEAANSGIMPIPAGGPSWGALLLWIWLAGSLLTAALFVARAARFATAVRRAGAAEASIQQFADAVGRSLGLRASPPVRMLDGVCSPMLWGCGASVRLLFPRALWHGLDNAARESLLAHELAHLRRGDQWVRLLELAVTVVFWWHPVVWMARRAIASSEEQCCDAWVIARGTHRPRVYADALVATLDFVADGRLALPPVASGIGQLPVLRKRLTLIMRRSVERKLPAGGRRVVAAFAAAVLPLGPVGGLSSGNPADAAPSNRLAAVPSLESINGRTPAATGFSNPKESAPPAASGPAEPGSPTPVGWWNARPEERWAAVTSPSGRFRLEVDAGHRVRLKRLDDGVEFDLGAARLTAAAFLPGTETFAAGALDGSLRIYDANSGESVSLIGWHQQAVTSVAVAPDGRTIASGSRDGAVMLWDAGGGRILNTWTTDRPVACVRFSHEGERLAIVEGHWNNTEQSYRTVVLSMAGGELSPVSAFETLAAVVEFLPDGTLLTADWSGRVVGYHRAQAGVLYGRVDKLAVDAARFSPDNRLLDELSAREPAPATF